MLGVVDAYPYYAPPLLLGGCAHGPRCTTGGGRITSATLNPGLRYPAAHSVTVRPVSDPPAPSQVELTELDIDVRVAGLWAEMHDVDEWTLEIAATFCRAAYAQGYVDALAEPEIGSLLTDNGYAVPVRTRPRLRRLNL